jgi:hypothetical protein
MLVGFGLLSSALSILAVITRIPLSWLITCLASLSNNASRIPRRIEIMRRGRCTGLTTFALAVACAAPISIQKPIDLTR